MSGGSLVPEDFGSMAAGYLVSDNIYRQVFPAPKRIPPTRLQRLVNAGWRLRYRIAKALYPPSYRDDE